MFHSAINGNVIICPQCCNLTAISPFGYDNASGKYSCGCITTMKCKRVCFFCNVKHNHKELNAVNSNAGPENPLNPFSVYNDSEKPFGMEWIFACFKCRSRLNFMRHPENSLYMMSHLEKLRIGQGYYRLFMNELYFQENY